MLKFAKTRRLSGSNLFEREHSNSGCGGNSAGLGMIAHLMGKPGRQTPPCRIWKFWASRRQKAGFCCHTTAVTSSLSIDAEHRTTPGLCFVRLTEV